MYEIAKIDLDKIERLKAELPSNIPQEIAKIPTEKEERDILRLIKGNAIWLILTYGAGILSHVSPILGKGLKAVIKWRFKNWEQKDLPFDL